MALADTLEKEMRSTYNKLRQSDDFSSEQFKPFSTPGDPFSTISSKYRDIADEFDDIEKKASVGTTGKLGPNEQPLPSISMYEEKYGKLGVDIYNADVLERKEKNKEYSINFQKAKLEDLRETAKRLGSGIRESVDNKGFASSKGVGSMDGPIHIETGRLDKYSFGDDLASDLAKKIRGFAGRDAEFKIGRDYGKRLGKYNFTLNNYEISDSPMADLLKKPFDRFDKMSQAMPMRSGPSVGSLGPGFDPFRPDPMGKHQTEMKDYMYRMGKARFSSNSLLDTLVNETKESIIFSDETQETINLYGHRVMTTGLPSGHGGGIPHLLSKPYKETGLSESDTEKSGDDFAKFGQNIKDSSNNTRVSMKSNQGIGGIFKQTEDEEEEY